MKCQKFSLSICALSLAVLIAADAQADRYSTFDPGGADAELRESQPTNPRGTGSELASRIADPGNRNSVIFLKFGVGDVSLPELASDITVRTTYRNNNLTAGRIEDTSGGGPNTGFDYYVLDPTIAGADWDEAAITPVSASTDGIGYVLDGDFSTKGTGTPGAPSPGLTYLGTNLFDSGQIGTGGHLDIGDNFDLTVGAGSPLHTAILTAQGTGHQTVTVAMAIAHEASNPNSNWLNFNYLFNPKEQDPLNDDPDSPLGGSDNSTGRFAPQLLTVPEPASIGLLAIGSVALLRRRR
ncbi:PEP-CTERM sorting domain-containing protein [Pirellulales bacterium]|nr:PEP-CTERM sorting domain-containing protein [Pirellulales bacterium]